VDIIFASKKLEGLCHDDELATRTLGPACARRLRARLDDLRAAANLSYAPKIPGRFHPLNGNPKNRYAFNLHGDSLLVIRSVPGLEAAKADEPIQLATITTICVVGIGVS
jgi:toxin HigB-1